MALTGTSLLVPGCATSPPLRFDDQLTSNLSTGPFRLLAESLPREQDYACQVEGQLPKELNGTLYRNGPGLFERNGLRKRTILDGDGMIQQFRF